jgi:hypothetical protein
LSYPKQAKNHSLGWRILSQDLKTQSFGRKKGLIKSWGVVKAIVLVSMGASCTWQS